MPSTTLQPEPQFITVPEAAPPYDCDAHRFGCPAGHDLARAEAYEGGPGTELVRLDGTGPAAAAVWPRQFAQALVEILAGVRSPRQIVPCTTDRVRATIDILTPQVTEGARPRILRVVMSHPAAHAVEMTVIVSFGPRARALALRCEHRPPQAAAPGRAGRPERWLCTELEAG